jgi:hypothetical protein
MENWKNSTSTIDKLLFLFFEKFVEFHLLFFSERFNLI